MDHKQMELFQTVCFLAMMQHGRGLYMKAPKYIQEKMKVSEDPQGAWNMLDDDGQAKVIVWASRWNFPIAECLAEISRTAVSL